ncbi:MAG: acyl-CoA/acyl-ACP dehydrogenase [Clostridia bacterium]|nr:acyl-CoA/acyl-ACP dehydrogenase [Clostridia bacterium]
MDFQLTAEQRALLQQVRDLCGRFPPEYWREKDLKQEMPHEFYRAFVEAGWVGMLVPAAYGGLELGLQGATLVMEEVAASGAGMTGGTTLTMCMFPINPLVRHGTEEQKRKYLPQVLRGELQVAFAVTEPDAGTDTTRIRTRAVRDGDGWRITGQKMFISKAQVAQKMTILVRTTPVEQVAKKTHGMTLFLADIDRSAVEIRPLHKLGLGAIDTNALFINDLYVSDADRIGEEGRGFYHILDGMNPERMILAAEAVGTGRAALQRAVAYARERIVFDRPIGQNQGIQFPLADAHVQLEVASLMVRKAAWLYDQGLPCGAEANMAKYFAAEAAFAACDRALQTLGGAGYIKDYDVERLWREVRLVKIGPVSQEMVLNYVGEHVLGLPRSY